MDTQRRTFRTPGGKQAVIRCRLPGTNDAMVAEAVIEQDEYRMQAGGPLTGVAVDVGAHIGTWTVLALLDNPELRVIAVEPIGANADLLEANLELNGLTDRAEVRRAALAGPKDGPTVAIGYDWKADSPDTEDMASMHRFIGNQLMPDSVQPGATVMAPAVRLGELAEAIDCLKIDAEGAEMALVGTDLSKVRIIVGEYHRKHGPLLKAMKRTHSVDFTGEDTFGAFRGELLPEASHKEAGNAKGKTTTQRKPARAGGKDKT